MKARDWLAVLVLWTGGCSVHSLDYLQHGDDRVTVAAGAAGAAGTGAAPGVAGSPVTASGGAAIGGAASGGSAGSDTPASRCDDVQMNGDEADVDCGGRSCAPCAAGKRCVMGTDCLSAMCTNQVCQPPSCTDLARNGDETDLNCGGSCPPCSLGHGCQVDADCETKKCTGSACALPNCDGASTDPGCPPLIDNTAYSLRPAHAPASCIDGVARGVDDGVAMQQYSCAGGVNQTFWALAAPGGYFALRNALSGKCLQVRANSLASDAVIEQATCSGQSDQLFLPSAESAGIKLSIQSSGLSLDVAGVDSSSNGQRIVQSVDDGSLDMRWSALKATSSGFLTLNALGQTDALLRHIDTEVRAEASLGPDSQWKVEPGLAAPSCVSFESSDRPGAYLRHSNSLLWTDLSDGSLSFSKDATFCFRPPLSGFDGAYRSLQSFNYPSNYISASDGRVRLLPFQETSQFRQLATWVVGQRN